MTAYHKIAIGHAGVTTLMAAIAAAEKAFKHYDGTQVKMEGEPVDLDYAADLERLKRARQVLDVGVTPQQRLDIVGALEYAGINMDLAQGMDILSAGPAGELVVDFGNARTLVANALIKTLGVDRRHPWPGQWLYHDPIGGPPQRILVIQDDAGERYAVFPAADGEPAAEVPVADMAGDFEQAG